jgi:hypothetical protein
VGCRPYSCDPVRRAPRLLVVRGPPLSRIRGPKGLLGGIHGERGGIHGERGGIHGERGGIHGDFRPYEGGRGGTFLEKGYEVGPVGGFIFFLYFYG